MTVDEIIGLISKLGVGLDSPTLFDAQNNLMFLNLAYSEIIRKTFTANPYIDVTEETVKCTDGILDDLSLPILSIKSVSIPGQKTGLESKTIDFISSLDVSRSSTGDPQYWYFFGGSLAVFPVFTGDVLVSYVPTPPLLALGGAENSILVHPLFHQLLVDGACYYLFQSEGGFKNSDRMIEAMRRWEDGKKEFFAHMRSLSGQKSFSTYSPV